MQRGEAGVDEGLQIGADRFTTVPIRNAEIADGILREAVKALPEGFVVNLLPHVEEPLGRFLLCKQDLQVSLLDFAVACLALAKCHDCMLDGARMIVKIVGQRIGSITCQVMSWTEAASLFDHLAGR